jgi:hypothetical protein
MDIVIVEVKHIVLTSFCIQQLLFFLELSTCKLKKIIMKDQKSNENECGIDTI